MTPLDFVRLTKLTNIVFNSSKWNGSVLEAQDMALKIMKEFNL